MILALLAATLATPALCPGDLSYVRAVSRAAVDLGVYNQLFVEVVPNFKAPVAVSPDGTIGGIAIAWVPRYPSFNWTIFIRYDMLHTMSCLAMRLSALHEVCHIKLSHHVRRVDIPEAIRHENEADACVKRNMTAYEWQQSNSDLTSAYLLARREKINPSDLRYFAVSRKTRVPTRVSNFYAAS